MNVGTATVGVSSQFAYTADSDQFAPVQFEPGGNVCFGSLAIEQILIEFNW